MSRYEIAGLNLAHEVVVGWDSPLQSYFGQVHDPAADEEKNPVHWVGASAPWLFLAPQLEHAMAGFAVIPPDTLASLENDRELDRLGPTPGRLFRTEDAPVEGPLLVTSGEGRLALLRGWAQNITARWPASMPMWAVFGPDSYDFPGEYVARLQLTLPVQRPTSALLRAADISLLRCLLPAGLTALARQGGDSDGLVEVWL